MKRLILPLLLCAALPSARADETTDLVKKAVEAHGGEEKLKKAVAGEVAMEGSLNLLGAEMKFTTTVVYQLPDKFAMSMDVDAMGMKLEIKQVVNGDKVKSTLNKMPQKVGDAEKAELLAGLTTQEMSFIYPLLDAKKYTLKLGKATEKEDELLVTPKAGKETKLYFDKKTHLLVRMARKGMSPGGGGEVAEETSFSDYKKLDGIMTPYTLSVTHDGEKFMKAKVTEGKYLEKVDAKKFATDD